MNRYDPAQSPDPAEWLRQDEQERNTLVEQYQRRARVDLPNLTLHAAMHVVAENQLALHDEPVVRALARLMEEGLTRHDAVHAIGSVVAEYLYDILQAKNAPDKSHAPYYDAI